MLFSDYRRTHGTDVPMQLTVENIKTVLDEYTNFYDGLVVSMNYSYTVAGGLLAIRVYVRSQLSGRKRTVRISAEGPREVRFVENNTCSAVMSAGLQIAQIGESFYVALSPYCDDMTDVEDFRRSDFYFAAKDVEVSLEDSASEWVPPEPWPLAFGPRNPA